MSRAVPFTVTHVTPSVLYNSPHGGYQQVRCVDKENPRAERLQNLTNERQRRNQIPGLSNLTSELLPRIVSQEDVSSKRRKCARSHSWVDRCVQAESAPLSPPPPQQCAVTGASGGLRRIKGRTGKCLVNPGMGGRGAGVVAVGTGAGPQQGYGALPTPPPPRRGSQQHRRSPLPPTDVSGPPHLSEGPGASPWGEPHAVPSSRMGKTDGTSTHACRKTA